MEISDRLLSDLRFELQRRATDEASELERLRNYQRNVDRLISRAQDLLSPEDPDGDHHPVFWVLDDLDDSYYGELPDSHFEEL